MDKVNKRNYCNGLRIHKEITNGVPTLPPVNVKNLWTTALLSVHKIRLTRTACME